MSGKFLYSHNTEKLCVQVIDFIESFYRCKLPLRLADFHIQFSLVARTLLRGERVSSAERASGIKWKKMKIQLISLSVYIFYFH